ncbi:MAG: hypothetical protein AAF291_04030 [Pseudomonadota bacterium]
MTQLPIPEWAAAVADAEFTDPALIQKRASKFERTIKRRNILEYAAGALCVVLFGALAIGGVMKSEYLFAAGGALCVVCTGIVIWQLHARGSYRLPLPEESCLDHLRSQYQRQYDALHSVPVWYLGPLAVGVFGFYALMIVQFTQIGGLGKALEGTWKPIVATTAFFIFVGWLNRFAARKLKDKIDQIDALV